LRSSPWPTPDRVMPCLSSTLTTPALHRRSLKWFAACACTPAARGLPSSRVQHGCSGYLCHKHSFAPSWRTVVCKAAQLGIPFEAWPNHILEPGVQDFVQIGSKGGALPYYDGTSPPSALRTGQATLRGIRLASAILATPHADVPVLDVGHP
jgi:hypothetical protein